jgi:stearoyl-CoA desaturase (delta-9 desaturase)
MLLPDWAVLNAAIDFLAHGVWRLSWWQVLIFTLVVTHITIASVTIFLHRTQAHRAMELGPIPSHFFRFWLWLTTGMVTKEWVAIHRKHHAKCETPDDPHSPQTRGIETVFWQGAELYRAEAKNKETLAKFSHGTPDDWIERNLYTRFSWQGVALMLIINVTLFGALGATVWAVQMLWIPVTAAGIINGIGHYWGYRNFEAPDASTNISPWGLIIGGEELHNNHHTYPTSAKLSVKPHEFDIGWLYIRILQAVGQATVRKTAPVLKLGEVRPLADGKTLEALIHHRYEVMADYAAALKRACGTELDRLREQGRKGSESWKQMLIAHRWLPRDDEKVPVGVKPQMAVAMASSPVLTTLVAMREELRQLWTRTNVSREQLVADLQAWCQRAEESGIAALHEMSLRVKAARI